MVCLQVHHFHLHSKQKTYTWIWWTPYRQKGGMRDRGEAHVLDTGQIETRVRLHNSWVDSYGQAIYDWVAFMSFGGGRQRSGKKEREKERGEKIALGLKRSFFSSEPWLNSMIRFTEKWLILLYRERMKRSLPLAAVRKHLLLPRALLVKSSVMSICACTSSLISSSAAYRSASQYSLSKQSMSSASWTLKEQS